VQSAHRRAVARKGAQLGHLGQHHGHDFDGIDFVFGIGAGVFGLHDQHAQLFAHALNRHTQEGREDFLARLGHVTKALFGRGIRRVDRQTKTRHAAH
jgi:hypothetical protein